MCAPTNSDHTWTSPVCQDSIFEVSAGNRDDVHDESFKYMLYDFQHDSTSHPAFSICAFLGSCLIRVYSLCTPFVNGWMTRTDKKGLACSLLRLRDGWMVSFYCDSSFWGRLFYLHISTTIAANQSAADLKMQNSHLAPICLGMPEAQASPFWRRRVQTRCRRPGLWISTDFCVDTNWSVLRKLNWCSIWSMGKPKWSNMLPLQSLANVDRGLGKRILKEAKHVF